MRKTDKKLDNTLRLALTEVCDIALKDIAGFQWLTHCVNYLNFPQSLKIICVFDTNERLRCFNNSHYSVTLEELIQSKLGNITLKNISKHIAYDSEENCDKEHDGQWGKRLD